MSIKRVLRKTEVRIFEALLYLYLFNSCSSENALYAHVFNVYSKLSVIPGVLCSLSDQVGLKPNLPSYMATQRLGFLAIESALVPFSS